MNRRIRFIGAVWWGPLLFWLASSGIATAQTFDWYKPRILSPRTNEPKIPYRPETPVVGSDQILVPSLDALVLLDRPEKVDPKNPVADAAGLSWNVDNPESLIYSEAAQEILRAYLGQPITLRRLNELTRQLIDFYRANDQPVVDVVIPEQNISEGTVQLVVVEPTIGTIRVSGVCDTDPCWLLSRTACATPGDLLRESSLREDLFWLNRSPFRQVELDLQPGAFPGTTDVNYLVREVPARRGYLGYEDTGVRSLMLERVLAGFYLGNVFGQDGTLGYQYTADTAFQRLEAHSVSFGYEFSRELAFQAYGSWSAARPNLPPPLNQSGESWQSGASLTRFLERTSRHQESVSLGADFKSTNNNLEFNGFNVQASRAELFQLRASYNYLHRFENDDFVRFNQDLTVGPGDGFSPRNTAAAFSTIRANTDPTYWYYQGLFERQWALPSCWQLRSRLIGQATSERLLFSEMLGLGGYDTVRGYDQRMVNGDLGWFTSFELGPQPWDIGADSSHPQSLKCFLFGDLGEAFLNDPIAGEDADQFLAGAGLGVRYNLSDRLSLRLDYGHAFTTVPGLLTHDRIHLGIVSYLGPSP